MAGSEQDLIQQQLADAVQRDQALRSGAAAQQLGNPLGGNAGQAAAPKLGLDAILERLQRTVEDLRNIKERAVSIDYRFTGYQEDSPPPNVPDKITQDMPSGAVPQAHYLLDEAQHIVHGVMNVLSRLEQA